MLGGTFIALKQTKFYVHVHFIVLHYSVTRTQISKNIFMRPRNVYQMIIIILYHIHHIMAKSKESAFEITIPNRSALFTDQIHCLHYFPYIYFLRFFRLRLRLRLVLVYYIQTSSRRAGRKSHNKCQD